MLLFPFSIYVIISLTSANLTVNGCQELCRDDDFCKATALGDVCYSIYTDKKRTWEESKEMCQSHHSTMARITADPASKQSIVLDMIKEWNVDDSMWLGAKSDHLDHWIYTNNVSLSETYASSGNNFHSIDYNKQCGVIIYTKSPMLSEAMEINKENCNKPHQFICRFDKWNDVNSFYISESTANWYDARGRCRELGGDLMYLERQENIHILSKKLPTSKNETMFIGLTKNRWQWEGGQHIWMKHLPSRGNAITKEECLVLNLKGNWDVKQCNANFYAVCQIDHQQDPNFDGRFDKHNFLWYPKNKVIFIISFLFSISVVVNVALTAWIIKSTKPASEKKEGRKKDSSAVPVLFEEGDTLRSHNSSVTYPQPWNTKRSYELSPSSLGDISAVSTIPQYEEYQNVSYPGY